jgi:CheY-like chemotaxis protein
MPEHVRGKFFTVLLVEDSDDDLLLYKRAMQRNHFQNPLQRVNDGNKAIAYLRGEGAYADRNKFDYPSLILTDLNMPNKSGLEMLEWIKNHPKYRVVPTIMITSSTRTDDIRAAYKAGADAYMVKQGDPDNLVQKLSLIFQYWAECELPTEIVKETSP